MDDKLLRELAALGAEKRVGEIEHEIAKHELDIERLRGDLRAICLEFGIKRSRDDDDGEPADDPNILSRNELRAEIQRVLAMSGGAIITSDRIAKAIESHTGKKIAIKRAPATRVAMMATKMPSVHRRDDGWIWNPVEEEVTPRLVRGSGG